MEDITEANAFEVMVIENPKTVIANGFRDNEPIFNVALMVGLAEDKLLELDSLPVFDLTLEKDRKSKEKAIRAIKKSFTDFDNNMKVIKDTFMPIPKKCDAVRKAVKDKADIVFVKALAWLDEIKAQTELVYNTWQEELWNKKQTIPHDVYSIEILLNKTEETEPCQYSSPKELEDFKELKAAYIAKVQSVLDKEKAAEKARAEEAERQAKEAARLAEERRALEAERQKQAAEAARIAEEQRRVEAEKAALERQRQTAQFAVPPPPSDTSEQERQRVRLEAETTIGILIAHSKNHAEAASAICRAVHEGKIKGMAFCYGEVGNE